MNVIILSLEFALRVRTRADFGTACLYGSETHSS